MGKYGEFNSLYFILGGKYNARVKRIGSEKKTEKIWA